MYAPLCIFLLSLNYEGHYLISHTPTVLQVNAKPITALPTPTQQPAQRYTSQDPCTFPQKCITESAQPLLEIHIKSHFTIHLSLRSSFTTHGGLRLLKYYPGISLDSQFTNSQHSLASCAKARRVAGQPGDHTPQLIGASNPSHRIQLGPFLEQVWLLVKVCCSHSGQHEVQYDLLKGLDLRRTQYKCVPETVS